MMYKKIILQKQKMLQGLMTFNLHEILCVYSMRLVEMYKKVGDLFQAVTPLLQKLLSKNMKKELKKLR